MGWTVGLMYNLGKYEQPDEGEPPDAYAELDSEHTVQSIADALAASGHRVIRIEGNEQALPLLLAERPDIVFNICEGLRGASRESHIPALLEMLGIPYTGSGILALALSLDKTAAKKHFHYHGIPTPAFRTVAPGEPVTWEGLRFPLFVKPAWEGSSKGISPASKVNNPEELCKQVLLVHQLYKQPAIVEEFIDGREFTVGLVGNDQLVIFPIREILFENVPPDHGNIYSYQFKQEWDDDRYFCCPAQVEPALEAALKQTAVAAFRALGCVDVSRVDLRLGPDGVPYVLEVNPLPGLSPGYSDLCIQAATYGWTYERLVNAILEAAIQRHHMQQQRTETWAETA